MLAGDFDRDGLSSDLDRPGRLLGRDSGSRKDKLEMRAGISSSDKGTNGQVGGFDLSTSFS